MYTFPTEAGRGKKKLTQKMTATMGRPFLVHLAKMIGACFLSANPYKIRDEVNRYELPAEKAEVKTHALTREGKPLTPARIMAIT